MTHSPVSGRLAGRVWNFSAGPSALPDAVIEQARDELPNWRDSGMSVMEMSHRSTGFIDIASRAESDFRRLLNIGDDYAVLFLQGGATLQFAMAPLNLLSGKRNADYFRTGMWSEKAVTEAERLCQVNLAVDTKATGYRDLPDPDHWQLNADAAFVHYTSNETIHGVQFHNTPDVGAVPLVADMSSDILSRPVDIRRFGLIYAGAQKNMGPAGLTVVVVRRDLLGKLAPGVPSMLDYAVHDKAGSMVNTPPTLAWYLAGLVFDWVLQQGGVEEMDRRNRMKADLLYSAIDASSFYANPVAPADRSLMNIPFTIAKPELESAFLERADAEGLVNLAGHRAVGGMRASIYNAMPLEGVQMLVDFMKEFERKH